MTLNSTEFVLIIIRHLFHFDNNNHFLLNSHYLTFPNTFFSVLIAPTANLTKSHVRLVVTYTTNNIR